MTAAVVSMVMESRTSDASTNHLCSRFLGDKNSGACPAMALSPIETPPIPAIGMHSVGFLSENRWDGTGKRVLGSYKAVMRLN